MNCPSCGSREVGYLPASQYYCWCCFVQFTVGDNSADVFEVDEDGTLVPLGRVSLDQGGPAAPAAIGASVAASPGRRSPGG